MFKERNMDGSAGADGPRNEAPALDRKKVKPLFRTLEPRMVFDAAAGVALQQMPAPASHDPAGDLAHHSTGQPIPNHVADAGKVSPIASIEKPVTNDVVVQTSTAVGKTVVEHPDVGASAEALRQNDTFSDVSQDDTRDAVDKAGIGPYGDVGSATGQVTEPVSRTPANESLSAPLQKGAVYLDLAHHHQGGEDAGAPVYTESRTNEQHAAPAGDSVAATHGVKERNAHTGPGGDVHSGSVATSSGTSTHYNPVFEPHSPDKAHGRLTDRDSRHTDPYEIGIKDVTFDMRSNDIYFVWDNVRDWEQITAELPDDARVYVLDSTKDGVEQIAAILGNENGISAIHLISHGSEGTLNLGSATLDANSMQDHYRDNLLTIGEALSENADILIYGCDFAAGEDGLQAALILSGITRADIAASIDPTGAASRGGNWTLERQIGAIEASAFTQVDYQFLLAAPSVDLDGTPGQNENSTVDYTENSPAVSIVANGTLGATVSDSDNDLQTLTITADNAPDGDDEHLSFNGVSIAMGSDSSNAVTVGATTYRIVYTAETRTFVITNDSGENIPSGGDTNTLVRSITYDNSSDDPTGAGAATSRVFSFIATDETGASSTPRTATVNITAVNDAPVNTLPASGWSTDEDAPVQLTGLQVSDPDVGTGSITVTLSVTSGSIDATDDSGVAVGGTPTARTLTGSLADINAYLASESAPTYTPAPDFNGDVTLTMTTSDNGNSGGTPLTDTDNSVITIDAINDAPVGVDDIVTIAEDGVASGNVLTNDTDADGDPLTVTQFVVDGTTYSAGEPATISGVGTLVINADGSYSFSPEENYDGSVPVVTYTVSDGGLESTATLSVSIDPVNDAPVDGDETNVVAEDTTLTVASGSEDSLLANTTDVDSTDFTVSAFSVDGQSGPFVIGAAYAIAGVGDITINADGSYAFTPAQNYTGAVPAITYTVSDASGGTDTSTLALTIVPSNDAPAGTDNTVTITEDTAYTFSAASFGFTDPEDTPANSFQAVIITTLPPVAEGTLYLNGVAVTEGQVIPAAELGNLTFEPAADVNGNGIGAFTFQVVDDGGTANNGQDTDQSPNTFAFNITNVNDVPVGVDDEATTPEDTPLDVLASSGLLSNDLDADGDTLTITQFSVLNVTAAAGQTGTIPGVGDLTINADGSYTFVPVENYVGPVPEITYTVVDGNGGTTTATLTLEVTPVNDPPVDGNETNTVTEDTALTVDEGEAGALLNNASDLDGDTLTITEFTVAGEAGPFVVGTGYLIAGVGTVTINANGSYSFVPVADYDGPIPVITYTVSDGAGGTDTSTLTLNMQPVNDAPIALDDAATTPENTPVSGNVLDNDTDVDNPTLTVTFFEIDGTTYGAGTTASIPGVGSLVINADGTYTFTPLPGYDGPVPTATYMVSDGDLTDTAELTLVITPLNDAPVADDDTGTTAEDTTLTVPAESGLLAGDTDIDDDPLTVTEFEIDGTIYSPGDTATVAGVGDLTINADGSYTFVPAADYNGPVPVATYTVSDGNGGTDQGTLTLEVTPVNDPPVAADDDGTTPEDTTLSGDVLANDTDIEGDDLTLVGFQVAGISGTFAAGSTATISGIGTVTINADGTYTLIPAANYTGPVPQITYIISDGNGGTDTATLDLVVTPVNDPPVANDDDASTPQDTPLNGNVIDNDTDVDGDTVVVTEFEINGTTYQPGETATIPGVGDITISADGSYNFSPAPGYNGPVPDVDYTISDGNGGTDDGTLHIDVIPPGGVGANNDVATTPEDTTLTGNVVSNDIDPNDPSGNSISVTEFTVGGDTYAAGDTATIPGIGALTINADGTYTFVPAANYFGPVPVVTYIATNGTASDTATLTITVTPVNDPPVAADDVAITPEDTPLNGNLLANDTDIESDGLIVTQFSIGGVNFNAGQTAPIPGVGQLTVNPDGTYTFVPFLDYNGPVPEVSYTISDGNGGTDTATLNIEVTPVNDTPVAEDDNATTPEDTTLTVAAPGLLANDADVDGDALSVSSFVIIGVPGIFTPGSTATIAGIGDLTINADGSYTFVPAENYSGSVPAVIYSVTDGTLSNTARLNIEVTPVNDAPVASDDIATVPEDTTLTVSAGTGMLSNDTDVEEGTLTVTEFEIGGIIFGAGTTASIPGVGALTVNSDGSYTFTPVANYNGPVPQVTYTVTDGDGGTDTALLTITVTPVNDPPVASDDTGTTVEDTELNGNVLPNDTDIDGDSLAVADFTIAGDATVYSAGETATIAGVGSLTIHADGTYTFSPAQDYAGPVPVITYTATDNNGGTDTATLTITVSPVNDAPVGVNETVTVDEDTTLTVPASSGVLSNDIDVDGDTLRVDGFSVEGVPGAFLAGATATLPGVGSLTINADGSYTFVPVANYNGPGPVATYRISDGVLTDTAVLTIIVAPVNDPPVDGDETNTVTEDTTLTVPAASGLLANTTDIDGGAPGVIDFTVAGEAGPFTIGSGYV
ncbi:Ig-like domain-containing protein, partial [Brucella cytisi]|uniref:Ig-like domain-containing protein n=1 Tax=Brucella cytisi TaxID=407152 RepID=UPI0035DE7BE7